MAEDPLADPDIVRAARYMIAQHRHNAASRAYGRTAELVIRGEHGAAALWGQITSAIQALQTENET
ncbi:MAG: hypothetical protein ACLQJR_04510 [Stellaceae bacterium]